jgi:hypothetical protein
MFAGERIVHVGHADERRTGEPRIELRYVHTGEAGQLLRRRLELLILGIEQPHAEAGQQACTAVIGAAAA